jgi:L-asparaginase
MAYRRDRWAIAGRNLTATKARALLMAALLKLGSLPAAADPTRPTKDERAAASAVLETYQEIFDTH